MQVDIEYHPVVLVFLGLPALDITSVYQVDVHAGKSELKASVQTGAPMPGSQHQQCTGDVTYPGLLAQPVFVSTFKHVLTSGER